MTGARTAAARLRGGFVGATSAAAAVAAHGAGGGAHPRGATVVLLVVACATVAAATTRTRPGLAPVLALVGAGQVIGHLVLTVASGHVHTGHWSPPMLTAHVVGAMACAVLICTAERLCAAAFGELRRLIVVTLDVADNAWAPKVETSPLTMLHLRILVRSGLATRAPPSVA
jgi:hypothetical protein